MLRMLTEENKEKETRQKEGGKRLEGQQLGLLQRLLQELHQGVVLLLFHLDDEVDHDSQVEECKIKKALRITS